MRKINWLSGILVLSLFGCSSMNNTEKGALGGMAVGTGAGALLGRGCPAAMVAGAAVGTMVGAVAGSNQDRREDYKNAQAVAAANAQARAQRQMSVDEIVQLSQRGTPDSIIIQQIASTGSRFQLTTTDLTYLQDQRVSNQVVNYMQTANPPRAYFVQPRPDVIYVAPPPPPVYVEPSFGVGVGVRVR